MTAWTVDWDRHSGDRLRLRGAVNELLVRHPNVASTAFFGSLASAEPDGFPADELSDIDIRVAIRGCSDLDFSNHLPAVLAPIGPVLLYSVFMSEGGYIASFLFEGYSPFWHVDIVCSADVHVHDPEVLERVHSERAFAAWLSALKRFVRAERFLAYFVELVQSASTTGHHDPAGLFSVLLEDWRADGATTCATSSDARPLATCSASPLDRPAAHGQDA